MKRLRWMHYTSTFQSLTFTAEYRLDLRRGFVVLQLWQHLWQVSWGYSYR